MKQFVVLLAVVVLGGVSCAGGGRVGGEGVGVGGGSGGQNVEPAPAPGSNALPALPSLHGASILTETTILGKDTYQRSAGAVDQDTALRLEPSGPKGYEWGMYRLNPGNPVNSLDVMLDAPQGGAYVGIANFRAGKWEYHGPFVRWTRIYLSPPEDYASPSGDVYCLVAAAVKAVTMTELTARVVVGEPAVVASEGSSCASLATDVFHNPAICFVGGSSHGIQYTRALDTSGEAWDTCVTVVAGVHQAYPSLALVYSLPAFSYHNLSVADGLCYVRAKDFYGKAWGTPVVVDAGFLSGWRPCLGMVNGFPAISYYNGEEGVEIRYVRAKDTYGALWSKPVTVCRLSDSKEASVGCYSSLAMVNGKPAISYGWGGLRYVQALDPLGSAWGAPLLVDDVGGGSSSLIVANNRPAISYLYFPSSGCEVRYVQATDAEGSSWGAPLTLDSLGEMDDYVCATMVVVNGKPAISYTISSNGQKRIRYVSALDPDGESWAAPVTLCPGWSTYGHLLAEINGKAGICYCDTQNNDLRYLRGF